jgi:hypothetical protein
MSRFRDKYINQSEPTLSIKDITKMLKQVSDDLTTPHTFYPEPGFAARQEVMKRVYLLAMLSPERADSMLTGVINTIAALFGDAVGRQAADGLSAMVGEILSESGMYLGYRNDEIEMKDGKVIKSSHVASFGANHEEDQPQGWMAPDGKEFTADMSSLLAKAAKKNMTMN